MEVKIKAYEREFYVLYLEGASTFNVILSFLHWWYCKVNQDFTAAQEYGDIRTEHTSFFGVRIQNECLL